MKKKLPVILIAVLYSLLIINLCNAAEVSQYSSLEIAAKKHEWTSGELFITGVTGVPIAFYKSLWQGRNPEYRLLRKAISDTKKSVSSIETADGNIQEFHYSPIPKIHKSGIENCVYGSIHTKVKIGSIHTKVEIGSKQYYCHNSLRFFVGIPLPELKDSLYVKN